MELTELSTEILIKIFEYCSIPDLCRLEQTCKRFNEIIKKTTTLGNTDPLLCTNQILKSMRNRSCQLLSLKEKYRISGNWRDGLYKENVIIREGRTHIPHFILTKENMWYSKGNKIFIYKRNNKNYIDTKNNVQVIRAAKKSEICYFQVKKNCLISGHWDGSIYIWRSTSDNLFIANAHTSDLHTIDIKDDIFVSGCKDGNIKLWHLKSKLELPYIPYQSVCIGDRIWSSSFSEKFDILAIGTAGYNRIAPVHVLDLNRFTVISQFGNNFAKGSGVLNLKWETPHLLLSCGYDKYIRCWDTRLGKCVQAWLDPFYSTVFCFDTDNLCTLVTGAQSHGRVVLWDKRSPRYVQTYFMETCKRLLRSSPIYRLSFDACLLFTATDYNLHVLDFSVTEGVPRDYSMHHFC
ncbi:hypothetical protein RN001_006122 [Aquatica leii]|uniref:F-box domain-containing protein n=1 Tax=Aquatica leii TaxID=1421715 RepID=A0AAN7PDN4_9COLE|nr:hypothetical protein RN001_006122 [Aquatica leii]